MRFPSAPPKLNSLTVICLSIALFVLGATCIRSAAQAPSPLPWLDLTSDVDGDGIPDYLDSDWDNDGVPNAVESPSMFYTAGEVNKIIAVTSGLTSASDFGLLNDGSTAATFRFNSAQPMAGAEIFKLEYLVPVQLSSVTIINSVSLGISSTAKLQGSVDGETWEELSTSNVSLATTTNKVFPVQQNAGFYKFYRIVGVATSSTNTGTIAEITSVIDVSSHNPSLYPKDPSDPTYAFNDLDGDGIPNHLDPDTDGDGTWDAIESGALPWEAIIPGSIPWAPLQNGTLDWSTLDPAQVLAPEYLALFDITTGRFTGPVGTNGLPDAVETSPDSGDLNYTSGYAQYAANDEVNFALDFDGDGIPDHLDPDMDGDGLSNWFEGYVPNNGPRSLAHWKSRLMRGSFHSAFYRARDGGYYLAGNNVGPDGSATYASPRKMSPQNGYNFTGDIIDVAAVGGQQHLLLTTDGLWVWGVSNTALSGTLTGSSYVFRRVPLNGQKLVGGVLGAPEPLDPAKVASMTASGGTGGTALLMQDGTVWVAVASTADLSLLGTGPVTRPIDFVQVMVDPSTPLTGITDMIFSANAAFAYSALSNTFYTWGPSSYLGDGSAAANRNFATPMPNPLPPGVKVVRIVTTASTYLVLGSDGRVYSLGTNAGTGSSSAARSWTLVQNEAGTAPIEGVTFIGGSSSYNSSTYSLLVDTPTQKGRLLSWGNDSAGMLGITSGSIFYKPTVPKGATVGREIFAVENAGHFTPVMFADCDGTIANTGHNPGGAFGDGSTTDRVSYAALMFLGELAFFCNSGTGPDGNPSWLSLDSDGDGCPDSVEAGPDGRFYHLYALSSTVNTCLDSDGDGIPDIDDIDDDNDGVPDHLESPGCFYTAEELSGSAKSQFAVITTEFNLVREYFRGLTDGIGGSVSAIGFANLQPQLGKELFRVDLMRPTQLDAFYIQKSSTTQIIGGNVMLQGSVDGATWTDLWAAPANPANATNVTASGQSLTNSNKFTVLQNAAPYRYYRIYGVVAANTSSGSASEFYFDINPAAFNSSLYPKPDCGDDIDGDGIPNHLDLDSDGDGCPDAHEAGATSDPSVGVIPGPYGESGLANALETTTDSGTINYPLTYYYADRDTINLCQDTDGDGIPDFFDDDADNDGLSDCEEGFTGGFDFSVVATGITNRSFEPSGYVQFSVTPVTTSSQFAAPAGDNLGNFGMSTVSGNGRQTSYLLTFTQPARFVIRNQQGPTGAGFVTGDEYQIFTADGVGLELNDPANELEIWNGSAWVAVPANYRASTIQWRLRGGTGTVPIGGGSFAFTVRHSTSFQWTQVNTNASTANGVTLNFSATCLDIDTDGDGIPNRLDLDSDGDNCPDAFEAGTSTDQFTSTVDGPYGNNGWADAVETMQVTEVPNITFTITNNAIANATAGSTLNTTNNLGGSLSGEILSNGNTVVGEWFVSNFRYTRKATGTTNTLTATTFGNNNTAYGRAGVGMGIDIGGAESNGVTRFSYQVRVAMRPGYRAKKIHFLGKNPTTNFDYGPVVKPSGVTITPPGGTIRVNGFSAPEGGMAFDPNDNLEVGNGQIFSAGQNLFGYKGQDKTPAETTWYLTVPAAEPVTLSVDFTTQSFSAANEATAFSVEVVPDPYTAAVNAEVSSCVFPEASISDVTVNEGSPYAIVTLNLSEGAARPITFTPSLVNGTGYVGIDTGTEIEYFNGTAWVSAAAGVTIPAGQTNVLLRVAIVQDSFSEISETVLISTGPLTGPVEPAGGLVGTVTINDDGTGDLFSATNTTGTAEAPGSAPGLPAQLDDDAFAFNADADGDGIPDLVDLDDDNDGLSDCEEGFSGAFDFTGIATGISSRNLEPTGFVKFSVLPVTTIDQFAPPAGDALGNFGMATVVGVGKQTSYMLTFTRPADFIVRNQLGPNDKFFVTGDEHQIFTANGAGIALSDPANELEIWNGTAWVAVPADYSANTIQWRLRGGTGTLLVGSGSFMFTVLQATWFEWTQVNNSATANNGVTLNFSAACLDIDTDGDGIPNRLDLDSDGDGCPDAFEAGLTGDDHEPEVDCSGAGTLVNYASYPTGALNGRSLAATVPGLTVRHAITGSFQSWEIAAIEGQTHNVFRTAAGEASIATMTYAFSAPVTDLAFSVRDLDASGTNIEKARIKAFFQGNEVEPTRKTLGPNVIEEEPLYFVGTSNNNTTISYDNGVILEYAGPVDRIVVTCPGTPTAGQGTIFTIESGCIQREAVPALSDITYTITNNAISNATAGTASLTTLSAFGGSMSGNIMHGTTVAGQWFLSNFRYTRKAVGTTNTITGTTFVDDGPATANPYNWGGVGVSMSVGTEANGITAFSYQVRVAMNPGYRAEQIYFLGKNPTSTFWAGPGGPGGAIRVNGFTGTNTGTIFDPNENLVANDGQKFSAGTNLQGYKGSEKTDLETSWYVSVPASQPVNLVVDYTGEPKSSANEATAFSVRVVADPYTAVTNADVNDCPPGPMDVSSPLVNETSPYAIFTVTGEPGQLAVLSLENTETTGLIDLEYFDGTSWVPYLPGTAVPLNDNGQLLVRVDLGPEQDPEVDGPETFKLIATNELNEPSTGGLATVVDDGTGEVFTPGNTSGDPSQPGDPGYVAPKDDRPVTVSSITVNEASPYAVVMVSGTAGQGVVLTLGGAGDTATSGEDYLPALQYFDGTEWRDYTPGAVVPLGDDGTLAVRVAILNDLAAPVLEGPETLTINATVPGGLSASGLVTIVDDGTGEVFTAENTGGEPSAPGDPGYPDKLDDDRSPRVSSPTVNEASPYVIFTVNGEAGESVYLKLDDGTADGADYGPGLEYFNGTEWVPYTGGLVALPGPDATLLVRVAIVDDTENEGPHTFTLSASLDEESWNAGTATIVDDGTGQFYFEDNTTGQPDELDECHFVTIFREDFGFVGINPDMATWPADVYTAPIALEAGDGPKLSPELVPSYTWAWDDGDRYTRDGSYAIVSNPRLGGFAGFINTTRDNTTKYTGGGGAMLFLNGSAPGQVAFRKPVDDLVLGDTYQLSSWVTSAVFLQGVSLIQPNLTLQVRDADGTIIASVSTGDIPNLPDLAWEKYTLDFVATTSSITFELVSNAQPGGGNDFALDDIELRHCVTPLPDDDRPLTIAPIEVNEASPYAVFTVIGEPGQLASLVLGAEGDTATSADDFGTTLQVLIGGEWVDYQPGDFVALDENGLLLVRTTIVNDEVADSGEFFSLTATNTGGTSGTGTATLRDDGTGDIYPDNTTGESDDTAVKDDERPLTLNSITVNEASPYAVFTVTGAPGQLALLTLGAEGDTATAGEDFGSALEYFNGTAWVAYSPGDLVPLDESGQLLVRTTIVNDGDPDNGETFTLAAANTAGVSATGTATTTDNGTGNLFGPDNTTGTPDQPGENGLAEDLTLDDDRPVPAPTVTLDAVTADNVLNIAESGEDVVLTGTTTGTQEGDTVTLTINGKEFTGEVDADGNFSITVPGTDLAADPDVNIDASVTTTNDFGVIGTGTATKPYEKDFEAPAPTITLDPVTADNILNIAEAGEDVILTGATEGTKEGDIVTLTINGKEYTGPVDAEGKFSITVPGADLAADPDVTVDASVTTTDEAGNPGSGTTTKLYEKDLEAPTPTIALDPVTADNILNIAESGEDVILTGTTTGTQEGDPVTLTINGKEYTGPVDAGGNFSITVPGEDLAEDSDLTIDASVTTNDEAGNPGTGTTTKLYEKDLEAPTPTITIDDVTPDNVLNAAEADEDVLITGTTTGTTEGDIVTLTINGKEYTGPVDADGNFSISVPGVDLAADADTVIDGSVTTLDEAGNPGSATSAKDYDVDTVPPALVVTSIGEDTGASATDNISKDNTPTITGTTEPGALVEIFANGESLGKVTAGPDGTFSFTTPVLADGPYDFTLTATDAAGNTTEPVELPTWTVDTSVTITITSIAGDAVDPINSVGLYDATERGDGDEAATLVVISGTTDAEPGQTVVITLNGKNYTAIVQEDGTWSVELDNADSIALNHGTTYPINASVQDLSGNTASTTGGLFALDVNIALPDVPIVDGLKTTSTTPVVGGTALRVDPSDAENFLPLELGDTMTITLNGVSVEVTITEDGTDTPGVTYDPATGKWTLDTAVAGEYALEDGTYDVTISVTAAGFTKTDISTGELIINSTPPEITIDVIAGDDWINAVEKNQSVTFSGTTTAEVGAIVTLTGPDGISLTAVVLPGLNGEPNYYTVMVPASVVATFTDGEKTLSASVTNEFGLTGTDERDYSVDTTPPPAPVITLAKDDVGLITDDVLDNGLTDDNLPVLVIEADPGTTVKVYSGGVLLGTATEDPENPGTYTLQLTEPLAEGPHTFVAVASDDAGNVSPSSAPFDLTVDTVPPVPTITIDDVTADNVVNLAESGGKVLVTGSTTDTNEGDIVTLVIHGVTYTGPVDAEGKFSIEVEGSDLAADNDTTIAASLSTQDAAGNIGTAETSKLYGVDTTAPTAPVINELLTSETSPMITGTAVFEEGDTLVVTVNGVTYTTENGLVIDGTAGTWSLALPELELGVYEVTATLTDAAGNATSDTSTDELTIIPLTVSSVTVNEASPYAVFVIDGAPGQAVALTLGAEGDTAEAGEDYEDALQYFDGTEWKAYTPGAFVALDENGQLLVRVAINNDEEFEESESFTLTATTPGGVEAAGTGTITDDGTGDIFLEDNLTATPDDPTAQDYEGPALDDDRPLLVADIEVNEGSPHAVFTVTGGAGQLITLALGADADNATFGEDYGNALEYFDGENWVPYVGGLIRIGDDGQLLVRTTITADGEPDNGETFTLTVTASGGEPASGIATILDNGTGSYWIDDAITPATPEELEEAGIVLDDDRTLRVSDITVNEGSPYAVFYVIGDKDQRITLALKSESATSDDYGPGLEYFDGEKWVVYEAGSLITLLPQAGTCASCGEFHGQILVRTPIVKDDEPDNGETFKLLATNTGGTTFEGTGTINDDGTGDYWIGDAIDEATEEQLSAAGIVLDDDRPLTVSSIEVNEASPYAVFTLSGAAGQLATLALSDGTASGDDYGPDLEYFDGSAWVTYTPGEFVVLDETGTLLVRTTVTDDNEPDGGETFILTATNTGGTSASGSATIMDDGTGVVFLEDNVTNIPDDPADENYTGPALDDDRPLTVNDIFVNEGSLHAVFTVTGVSGQLVSLKLSTGTAEGNDFGIDELEVFINGQWTVYTPDTLVALDEDGTLRVRTTIVDDDTFEIAETFDLQAFNVGGARFDGTATILDDGSGDYWIDDAIAPATPAELAAEGIVLDDDRPLMIEDITVNEGSTHAVVVVSSALGDPSTAAGQLVSLQLGAEGDSADRDADYSADYEVLIDGAWVEYEPGSYVPLDANGQLFVRIAIVNDEEFEVEESFTLIAANAGGAEFQGTVTIFDDGTGSFWIGDATIPATDEQLADGEILLDDDRIITVTSPTANEGSPHIVFFLSSLPGEAIMLDEPASGTATVGTDTNGSVWEVFNGTTWVAYTPGGILNIPASGQLAVRIAIENDTENPVFEGPESFTLTAYFFEGTKPFTGTGTIVDDGTGDYWIGASTTPATEEQLTIAGIILDDDRPLSVSDETVNEGSDYVVFTVSGEPGQLVSLDLGADGDTATMGEDHGPDLQYFNGSIWVTYTSGTLLPLDENGKLLVRTAILQDDEFEGSETFTLSATNSGGASVIGIGTIKDDGTGDYWIDDSTRPATPAELDDAGIVLDADRPIEVTGGTYNEGSPVAFFTVLANPNQRLTLTIEDVDTTDLASAEIRYSLDEGATWQVYTGQIIAISRTVLVSVEITSESEKAFEDIEELKLLVNANMPSEAEGSSFIVDDGSGDIIALDADGNPLVSDGGPVLDALAVAVDDRPLTVSDITVHESLGHAVFTVTGAPFQQIELRNEKGTADESDYGPEIEYFDGDEWVLYEGGLIALPQSGILQVRVPLIDDGVEEGVEFFYLVATNTGGSDFEGMARVPDRVVELYVMEGTTEISPYGDHFNGFNSFSVVGGIDALSFVENESLDLSFTNPIDYAIGGDNQYPVVVQAEAEDVDPDQVLFIVNVMSLKAIQVTPLTELRLDRQSGLYKQVLRVSNLHAHAIHGFRFSVDLIEEATLFNSNDPDGRGRTIRYDGILAKSNAPGDSVDLTIEVLYKPLSSNNQGAGAVLPDPDCSLEWIAAPNIEPEEPPAAPPSDAPAVEFLRLFNGDFMIEWDTMIGRRYAVEYTHDLQRWVRVNPVITANAHRTQWIDNGAPKTENHPTKANARFYRVVLLPEE